MNPIALALALGCPDPAVPVAAAEKAAIEGRFEDIEGEADRATGAFSCGPAADPDLLARLWNAHGAALQLQGDGVSAAIAFRSAERAAPGVFDVRYGSELRAAWAAASLAPAGEAALRLDDTLEGVFVLDGVGTALPAVAPDGLHLVQAVGGDGVAWHAERVFLTHGETRNLHIPPRPSAETSSAPAGSPGPMTHAPKGDRFPALLVAGSAGLILGGASAVGALAQDASMTNATSLADLDAAFTRQRLLGYAAYPLLGLGAVGVTLHFML